jgi:hypothetical protein
MLARLGLTRYLLCHDFTVFMLDADVVYFRNPFDYVLHSADVMLTVDRVFVGDAGIWGGPFFLDFPDKHYSLNNGVWFVRKTLHSIMFIFEFTSYSYHKLRLQTINSPNPNKSEYFLYYWLQLSFNDFAKVSGSKVNVVETNNSTSPRPIPLNIAKDCCDCYQGKWWYRRMSDLMPSTTTTIFQPSKVDFDGNRYIKAFINVGIFPIMRFTSYVSDAYIRWEDPWTMEPHYDLSRSIADSLRIFQTQLSHPENGKQRTAFWDCQGWKGVPSRSYPGPIIYLHAAGVVPSGQEFDKKKKWFKDTGIWFIPDS